MNVYFYAKCYVFWGHNIALFVPKLRKGSLDHSN